MSSNLTSFPLCNLDFVLFVRSLLRLFSFQLCFIDSLSFQESLWPSLLVWWSWPSRIRRFSRFITSACSLASSASALCTASSSFPWFWRWLGPHEDKILLYLVRNWNLWTFKLVNSKNERYDTLWSEKGIFPSSIFFLIFHCLLLTFLHQNSLQNRQWFFFREEIGNNLGSVTFLCARQDCCARPSRTRPTSRRRAARSRRSSPARCSRSEPSHLY